MADTGRERGHGIVDIGAAIVPELKPSANESVPQIANTNLSVTTTGGPAQTNTKFVKHLMDMGFLAAMRLRFEAWRPLRDLNRIEHGLLLPILLHCVDPLGRPMLGPPREGQETEAFLRTAYHDITQYRRSGRSGCQSGCARRKVKPEPSGVAASVTMKAGASDFIEKPISRSELLTSVDRALEMVRDASKLSAWREDAATHVAGLTPRQRQVMDMVLARHPSKNIAADLGISQRTVENHRASIMAKTGTRSLPARLALAAAVNDPD